jgi:hypothetical protein
VITCGDKRISGTQVDLISSNKRLSEFWGGLFTVLLSFWNSTPSCMKFCAGLPISDVVKKTRYFHLAIQMKKLLFMKNLYIVLNQIFQSVCDIFCESPVREQTILFSNVSGRSITKVFAVFNISRSLDLVNTLPVICTWDWNYSLQLCGSCLWLFLFLQHFLLTDWTLLFLCSVHVLHHCTALYIHESNLSRGKLCKTDIFLK